MPSCMITHVKCLHALGTVYQLGGVDEEVLLRTFYQIVKLLMSFCASLEVLKLQAGCRGAGRDQGEDFLNLPELPEDKSAQ